MAETRYHQTAHFIQRASERGLSLENIKNVVRYPMNRKKSYRGIHSGWVYVFSKTVDGVKLNVVAEIKSNDCWLMTAYENS